VTSPGPSNIYFYFCIQPQAEEVVAILEGMDKVCDELADLMSGDNDVNDEI